MCTRTLAQRALLALILLAAPLSIVLADAPARAIEATDPLSCGDAAVTKTLPTGSSWRLCTRIHPMKGLILESVEFRPATGDREYAGYKRVLDELYLAQLNVPYDDGTTYYNDITSYGFGDEHLVPLTSDSCIGETMAVHQSYLRFNQPYEREIPGICLEEHDTGLATHSVESSNEHAYGEVQRGTALSISSVSKVGWYEYQQKVTLTDQGDIEVGLGATGQLASGTAFFLTDEKYGWPIGGSPERHAASHWHNAVYRVDFGIDAGTTQAVEEWSYQLISNSYSPKLEGIGTTRSHAFTAIPGIDHDETTWWRVLNPSSLNPDGHPRSYEIVNSSVRYPYVEFTKPTISFTNSHTCQEYASMNLHAECPGQSVLDYVENETEPLTDPVAWVNVGFHHIVRDEDQSPMPVHWQGFSLVPRDFLAQQARTPLDHTCINGMTNGQTTSCTATNVREPSIRANNSPVAVGTVLTASAGTWDLSRTNWEYSYLWHRDGEPITTIGEDGATNAMTGTRYVVTEVDRGHEISVHVTASSPGFHSATAVSHTIRVPGPAPTAEPSVGPTTSPSPSPVVPSATTSPRRRTKTKIKVRPAQTAKGRPRARIRVISKQGTPTGRIKIWRGSKRIAVRVLRNGKITLRLPRPGSRTGYRLKVRYLGDASHTPSRSRARVRAR